MVIDASAQLSPSKVHGLSTTNYSRRLPRNLHNTTSLGKRQSLPPVGVSVWLLGNAASRLSWSIRIRCFYPADIKAAQAAPG